VGAAPSREREAEHCKKFVGEPFRLGAWETDLSTMQFVGRSRGLGRAQLTPRRGRRCDSMLEMLTFAAHLLTMRRGC
jgi:hypothetical protein